jgi:hypothetical protein
MQRRELLLSGTAAGTVVHSPVDGHHVFKGSVLPDAMTSPQH